MVVALVLCVVFPPVGVWLLVYQLAARVAHLTLPNWVVWTGACLLGGPTLRYLHFLFWQPVFDNPVRNGGLLDFLLWGLYAVLGVIWVVGLIVSLVVRHAPMSAANTGSKWVGVVVVYGVVLLLLLVLPSFTQVQRMDQREALAQAVLRHDLPQVKRLIQQGAQADFNHPALGYSSVMNYAIKQHQSEVVKLLLQSARRDIYVLLDTRTAGEYGTAPIVDLFLANGGDINAAFAGAVAGGQAEIAQLLAERGADVNQPDVLGTAPLLLAANSKNSALMAWLVDHADPKAFAANGTAMLKAAAQSGDVAMLDLLLQRGLPVNGQDAYGRTALMAAAESGSSNIATIELLLQHGADRQLKDTDGRTALDLADDTHPEFVIALGK